MSTRSRNLVTGLIFFGLVPLVALVAATVVQTWSEQVGLVLYGVAMGAIAEIIVITVLYGAGRIDITNR